MVIPYPPNGRLLLSLCLFSCFVILSTLILRIITAVVEEYGFVFLANIYNNICIRPRVIFSVTLVVLILIKSNICSPY